MTCAVARAMAPVLNLSDLWPAAGAGVAELRRIAADLGGLAAHDPSQLAQVLHDALNNAGNRGEMATIVAPNMNQAVLDALGRLPLGREVVRIVHTAYATTSFGAAQTEVLDRLAAAVAGFARDAEASASSTLHSVLGAPTLVQSLLPQGQPRLEQRARPLDHAADGGSTADNRQAPAPNAAAVDFANGLLDGLEAFGDGIEGGVATVGKGVAEATLGAGSCLLEGRVGEAAASVVRGTDRAVFQSTERLCIGVRDGAQSVCDGATDAAGPPGQPVRWLTDRLFDVGDTLADTTFGLARDLFRLGPDACTGFIGDVERAVRLAAAGRWGDGLGRFGMAFVHVPARLVGGVVDMLMRSLQCIASVAQTLVGAEPPARKLSADERAYLERVYGDSIDYDKVRVKQGGPLNDLMHPHTVGNTIYMPSQHFAADGTLTEEGLHILGHETGHVWQNQNGGGDYIHDALWSQLMALLGSGDAGNAYDWREALARGESFETMNDEERASIMEDLGRALSNDGQISAGDAAGDPYTAEEIAFLTATAEAVKAGQGAG